VTNQRSVWSKFVCVVLLACLVGGFAAEKSALFAQSAASGSPAQPAARAMGEYWFYTPPTDRSAYPDIEDGTVKNVIFMIGDGMGMAQVSAARIRAVGPGGRLHMDRMPVTGFVTTYSEGSLVTDSGAAATALATGFKTGNGMISLLPDGRKLLTILEAARDKKMATGLAVVCNLPHATPAAFAAHVPSRDLYPQIYEQMIRAKVDVLFGSGGVGTTTQPSAEATQARENGYQVISDREQLRSAKNSPVVGLLPMEEPTKKSPQPMLAEMTAKAIELLNRNPKGFFLMVEGSDIDWASHGNDTAGAIRKTLLFDLAVKEALEFAARDKHTLVIVTADHETGGMAIVGGSADGVEVGIGWTSKGHTGITVPLYAFGPGARRFMGVHDNTDIPRIFAQLLGIKDFPKVYPKN